MLSQELVRQVKPSVSIGWALRESAHACNRVRKLIRKFGYPPGKQEAATKLIIKQAETLCQEWSDS